MTEKKGQIIRMSFFQQVNGYNFLKNGVKITVFDTPGFADGGDNEEEFVKKIREKVTKFDVFIFCTEMYARRFRNDDIKTIRKLTEAFGPQLWEHAVVGLTFANEVYPPRGAGMNTRDFFDDRVREYKKTIKKILENLKDPDVNIFVGNLAFAPTGDLYEPGLPGIPHWITALWVTTFRRLNNSTKPAFYLANMDRFRPASSFGVDRKHGPSPGDLRNLYKTNPNPKGSVDGRFRTRSTSVVERSRTHGSHSPANREGMNRGRGSSTGFVPHIYLQEFDQVQGDLCSCYQNGDTASDRRPITRSVSMMEMPINQGSHLPLRTATIGTDHGGRGPAESSPSINLVPPSVRENLRDIIIRSATGAVRVVFERILSGSGVLVVTAFYWIFDYFRDDYLHVNHLE